MSNDDILETRDPLQEMIDAQIRLSVRYTDFTAQTVTQRLIDNAMMLADEAHEALREMPWKKHRAGYGREATREERDRYLEETVDALHYVLNMFVLLDYTDSALILREFERKNSENNLRVDHGE